MNVLSLESVSKTLKDDSLFSGVTFGLDEGDHVGLIGRNGQGKSTLLRLIAGQIVPDTGTIAMYSGTDMVMLEQYITYKSGATVLDYLYEGQGKRLDTYRAYHDALDTGTSGARLSELTALMEGVDGWTIEADYRSLLGELGLYDLDDKPMDSLSGGMQKKVAIARVLCAKPTFLLLDEPTNHLDIDTIEWLELYLKNSQATIILVTHDRYFLDSVCSTILELDNRQVYLHPGFFTEYLARREERLERLQKEQDRLQTILRRELEWLKRGPKARTGKDSGRKDRIEAMLANQRDVSDAEQQRFSSQTRRLGKKVLEVKNISKSYDGRTILRNFSFSFTKGARIGIVGPNGSGKSTLLDLLCGHTACDEGVVDIGVNTVFGYYDQLGRNLTSDKTILEYVQDIAFQVRLSPKNLISAAKFLELFGFPTPMHRQSISLLSGGERRRLYLLSRLLGDPNFLLLDEPTNDLDLPTMENLEQYIEELEGCVLVVSHDRAFLDLTCNELLILNDNGTVRYEAKTYSQWKEQEKPLLKTVKKEEPKSQMSKKNKTKGLTFNEKKELAQIETTIAQMEERIQSLEASFSDPHPTKDGTLAERTRVYHALREELSTLEDRWLELSEKS